MLNFWIQNSGAQLHCFDFDISRTIERQALHQREHFHCPLVDSHGGMSSQAVSILQFGTQQVNTFGKQGSVLCPENIMICFIASNHS